MTDPAIAIVTGVEPWRIFRHCDIAPNISYWICRKERKVLSNKESPVSFRAFHFGLRFVCRLTTLSASHIFVPTDCAKKPEKRRETICQHIFLQARAMLVPWNKEPESLSLSVLLASIVYADREVLYEPHALGDLDLLLLRQLAGWAGHVGGWVIHGGGGGGRGILLEGELL